MDAPPASRSHSLFPVIAAGLLVIAGFGALVAGSGPYVGMQAASQEPYNLVVQGFREGHVWMAKVAPPALAGLANPYAFAAYKPYLAAPWGLIDLSYYKGHLFSYFGITPAVILFWPWRVLTGASLHQASAVLLFSVLGYGAAVWLAVAAWRRYFPGVGPWAAGAAALLLGSATTLPVFLVRPGLYEVSISCGFMLTMLSLVALWESWHRAAGKAAWLAAASLAYGLAVGARPTLLFGAVILLVPVWTAFMAHRRGEPVPSWRRLLPASVLPIAAVGAGLAAFNFLRFGDPLQFGHEYQLSGNDVYGTRSFGLGFFWDNVRLYFLEPLRWHAGFPYVWRPATPPLTPGHLPVEFFFGTFTNTPVLLAAGLLLLSLWRILPGREVAGPASVAILLFTATALPICFYAGATSRYLVDFIPALALLAAVGFFAAEASVVRTPEVPAPEPARALAPVLRAVLLYSVAVSWLLAAALSMFYRGAEQGIRLLNTGHVDEGAAVLARMCRVNPDYAGPAELAVGSAYLGSGQAGRADDVLRAAVANSPGLGAAHYALGQALLAEGRFQPAADAFGTALRIDPADGAAEADLGVALFRLGRIPEAIDHERAALALDPSLADARTNLRVLEALPRR